MPEDVTSFKYLVGCFPNDTKINITKFEGCSSRRISRPNIYLKPFDWSYISSISCQSSRSVKTGIEAKFARKFSEVDLSGCS